jgi:hypothetical protein
MMKAQSATFFRLEDLVLVRAMPHACIHSAAALCVRDYALYGHLGVQETNKRKQTKR